MAQKSEVTEWSELLEATRHALTTLQLEDLEALAVRAEELLQVTSSHKSPSPGPGISHADRGKLLGEHRLLGSLLAATDSNLEVLRHLRRTSPRSNRAGGLDSRWVR